MTTRELATRNAETSRTNGSELGVVAIVTIPWMERIEEHPSWEVLSQLRITLRAVVALSRFKVQDLLELQEGQVFESFSPDTEDVALLVGQVQLGWSEFEVLNQRIAVRLTRLG